MEANKEDAKLSRENGEAALRNEDFEKAVRLFRKAARMSPDDSSITALSRLAEQQAEGCRIYTRTALNMRGCGPTAECAIMYLRAVCLTTQPPLHFCF